MTISMGEGSVIASSQDIPKQFHPSLSVPGAPPVRDRARAPLPWSGPALWLLRPTEHHGNGMLWLPSQASIRPGRFELPFKLSRGRGQQRSRGRWENARQRTLMADVQPEIAQRPSDCKRGRHRGTFQQSEANSGHLKKYKGGIVLGN